MWHRAQWGRSSLLQFHEHLHAWEEICVQVLLVLLAVDAGRNVGDQVREEIAKSLAHFSAKVSFMNTFKIVVITITTIVDIVIVNAAITLRTGHVSEG